MGIAGAERERFVGGAVRAALSDTRVVGVVGPRQAGKSTLVQQIVADTPAASYATLDDLQVRAAAAADPHGFVSDRPGMFAIDEVQRVPDLMLAIKSSVDRDNRPGRFLITGSSQLSANRNVVETLAGRIERVTMWPFSQDELQGARARPFVDRVLAGAAEVEWDAKLTKLDYLQRALAGGYPEAVGREVARRGPWFASYVQTVIEREAPGVSASPRTAELPRLLRLVAARHAGILNIADLASDAQLPRQSVSRYLDVLEALFLSVRLPAWSPNLSQREIRAPKIYVTDSGLAGNLRRADLAVLSRPELANGADGALIEGFVVTELIRQSEWSARPQIFSHYRDRAGAEVDLIIEAGNQVIAIEVKAGSMADRTSVTNLTRLREHLGARFAAGVILHTGARGQQLGDRLFSLPVAVLWQPAP